MIGYYSDNLYLAFEEDLKYVFMSLDAEKMEASHSPSFLAAMGEIYKTNAGITDSEVSQVFDFLYDC